MNKNEVLKRIKGLDEEIQKSMICAMVGHSKIVESCVGQITCARCDDMIGDTLGGVFDLSKCVIIGHDCETCRKNYKSMTWQDKLMTKEPF